MRKFRRLENYQKISNFILKKADIFLEKDTITKKRDKYYRKEKCVY